MRLAPKDGWESLPSFISYFGLDTASNTPQVEGAINGVFQAGGLIGALTCTWTADKFGRRKALFVGSMFATVGGALQAGSVHMAMFIIMRFISGLGIGALITLVPLYLTEVAPPKIRGLVVGTTGIMIGFGYASASWIGFGFYFLENGSGAQWRVPIAIQCVPALGLAFSVFFLAESPRWQANTKGKIPTVIANDRYEEAFQVFVKVHAESSDQADMNSVHAEFELIRAQIIHEKHNAVRFLDLFTHKTLRRRTLVGFLTLLGGQAAGTQVVNNYGPSLYAALGYDGTQTLLIQCCWITTVAIGNIINASIIDKLGRRPLLHFGFAACIIAMIGECVTVSTFQRSGSRPAASAAVFFLFLEVFCYASTLDATTYVYSSEVFPTPMRAKGMAVSISGLFLGGLLILEPAPTAFASIHWKYFLVFVCASSVMLVVVHFLFPETNQKSLEEISALFGDTVEHDPVSADGQNLSIFEDRGGDKAPVDVNLKVKGTNTSGRSD
ncbi:hypothetical protein H2202_002979 [Exophiala xenobiotica]|nr:hypothetical protein H2202_002979 [Exophiala xenobiotica]